MGKAAWAVLCGLSCLSCLQHSVSWSETKMSSGFKVETNLDMQKAGQQSLLGFLQPPCALQSYQKRVAIDRVCRLTASKQPRVLGLRMVEGKGGDENPEPWSQDQADNSDASSLNQYATYGQENGVQTPAQDGGAFRVPQKKTGEGWIIGKAPAAPALDEEDMTEELKERVLAVMIDAFDNLNPIEVERKLEIIWSQGPDGGPNKNTLRSLVALTSQVEGIAKASRDRWNNPGADFEDLLTALQVARSRVRMYGKDAEYYDPDSFMSWMNPDLNPRVQDKAGPKWPKWPWQSD